MGLPGAARSQVSAFPAWLPFASMPGLPGGNSLSFASPKESKQRKGDPQSGSLRFASGNLRCSRPAEFLETCLLRSLRTSKNLFPLTPALLSPARTGFGKKFGSGVSPHPCPLPAGEGGSANPSPNPSPQPVLAGLEKVKSDGLKNLDVRRRHSRLVSKNSAAFEHRKLPEAERRDPGCGSPFLCLLSFGEAKKSELQPGNPRHAREGQRS